MSKLIALSWTRLETFEQCPRKFQGSYITKEFPKPDFDAEHFRKGRAVHKAIEDRIKYGTPIPNPIRDDKGGEWYMDLSHLDKFLISVDKAEDDQKLVEKKYALDHNYNAVDWFNRATIWRCAFDLCVVIGNTAIIIDWKTGKVKQASDQLKLFAAFAFTVFPQVTRVVTAYVWCENQEAKPSIQTYDRAQHQNLWLEFGDRGELVQMANESGNWPARKNSFCKWCDALPTQCEYKGA